MYAILGIYGKGVGGMVTTLASEVQGTAGGQKFKQV
jgi:hypothetical protein